MPTRLSLFWRTFLLIAALIALSLVLWLSLFRAAERAPRAQGIALSIASTVNLTRAALISADAQRRQALLSDLAREEGIRIVPFEPTDQVGPPPRHGVAGEVAQHLIEVLGTGTRVATEVDREPGLWVSFDIEGDAYWAVLDRSRIERQTGPSWMLWGLLTLGLSLAGALLTSRLVNTPLTRLTRGIGELARGHKPAALQEDAPGEIAAVNRQFNRLATELSALEADRTLALAGISHDLRTPLTRLRLEVELSPAGDATKQSMIDDIDQIDRVIDQFIEFARGASEQPSEPIDVNALFDSLRQRHRADIDSGSMQLDASAVRVGTTWFGRRSDLERIVMNLVENARRYGAERATGCVRLDIGAFSDASGCHLSIGDYGAGIAAADIERLRRPFARGDAARSHAGGAGLGLAIVSRLAERYGGTLTLVPRYSAPAEPGGLIAIVRLPHARNTSINSANRAD